MRLSAHVCAESSTVVITRQLSEILSGHRQFGTVSVFVCNTCEGKKRFCVVNHEAESISYHHKIALIQAPSGLHRDSEFLWDLGYHVISEEIGASRIPGGINEWLVALDDDDEATLPKLDRAVGQLRR